MEDSHAFDAVKNDVMMILRSTRQFHSMDPQDAETVANAIVCSLMRPEISWALTMLGDRHSPHRSK